MDDGLKWNTSMLVECFQEAFVNPITIIRIWPHFKMEIAKLGLTNTSEPNDLAKGQLKNRHSFVK